MLAQDHSPQNALPGIIGLASGTNIVYYQAINRIAKEIHPEDDLEVLLHTVNFEKAVRDLRGGSLTSFTDTIVASARKLAAGGADFLVISSNTSHAAAKEIEETVGLPVLDIRRVAANKLREKGISKVGIVCTSMTAAQGLYQDILKTYGIEVVVSSPSIAKELDEVIFDELVFGETSGRATEVVGSAIDELSHGSEAVLLACTDLTHIGQDVSASNVFDTTLLHAEAAARTALGSYLL
jgi:aspartate racemase